jgi:hypothetical protein
MKETGRILIWKPPSKAESWEKKIWEDNINSELKKIACKNGIWMELAEVRKQ